MHIVGQEIPSFGPLQVVVQDSHDRQASSSDAKHGIQTSIEAIYIELKNHK